MSVPWLSHPWPCSQWRGSWMATSQSKPTQWWTHFSLLTGRGLMMQRSSSWIPTISIWRGPTPQPGSCLQTSHWLSTPCNHTSSLRSLSRASISTTSSVGGSWTSTQTDHSVLVNKCLSDTIYPSTGSPLGCVFSPLYSVHRQLTICPSELSYWHICWWCSPPVSCLPTNLSITAQLCRTSWSGVKTLILSSTLAQQKRL